MVFLCGWKVILSAAVLEIKKALSTPEKNINLDEKLNQYGLVIAWSANG